MTRIFKKRVAINVTGIGPANRSVDILITIVIQITKSDSVAFLQMAESARCGDVLKTLATVVAEHPIGNDRAQVGITRAEVEIKKTVIVEVAKVACHAKQHFVEAGFPGDVAERAVMIVPIKAGAFTVMRQAQVVSRHRADIFDPVTARENVQPTVVVEIKEPARKTVE